jgi:hypothetical protein
MITHMVNKMNKVFKVLKEVLVHLMGYQRSKADKEYLRLEVA